MAAASLKRINSFALGEARTHKKFFIIANIILGMGGLLYTFMTRIINTETHYPYFDGTAPLSNIYFEPSLLGIFLLVVGGGIGLMGAAAVFRDMNSVQVGDVQLSLPMTANERFFSKLLALCYVHIFPVIVWTGVPSLTAWIRCLLKASASSVSTDIHNAEYIPVIFLAILAGTLFVDAVTVLCTVCCGALAESIYFTLISMTCLSVAPAMIYYNLTESCAGQSVDLGMAFSAWTLSFVVNIEDDTSRMIPMLCINCLISVLVLLLTVFIYRRRDARSLGSPIANRVFFECVMFAGLMTVYGIFFFRTKAYIGFIITAIIYIVIHVISSRGKLGVKQFAAWVGKFAVSTAVYIALSAAAYTTGGFGMVTHLPMADLNGANVQISMEQYTSEGSVYIRYDTLTNDYTSGLTDEQIRQAARIFQKYAANHKKSLGEFADMLWEGNFDLYYDGRSSTGGYNAYIRIDKHTERAQQSFRDDLLDQHAYITSDEAEAMDKELQALGLMERNYSVTNYNDYNEYGDTNVYDEPVVDSF